jgi:hypothetical protein
MVFGLNNLNKSDCLNATVQALAHVTCVPFVISFYDAVPVNPLIYHSHPPHCRAAKNANDPKVIHVNPSKPLSPLVQALGSVLSKIWSPHRFKSTLDAHTLVHAISVASNKAYEYQSGNQAQASDFMVIASIAHWHGWESYSTYSSGKKYYTRL